MVNFHEKNFQLCLPFPNPKILSHITRLHNLTSLCSFFLSNLGDLKQDHNCPTVKEGTVLELAMELQCHLHKIRFSMRQL